MAEQSNSPLRVLLIDDSELARAGYRALFLTDRRFQLMAAITRSADLDALAVELVMADPQIDEKFDLSLIQRLREAMPSSNILIVTDASDLSWVPAALNSGVGGIIHKSRSPSWFILEAAHLVATGQGIVVDRYFRGPALASSRVPVVRTDIRITPREREILHHLALGRTDEEVARLLGIATTTVQTHASNLLQKLGLANRIQLGIYALEANLLGRAS